MSFSLRAMGAACAVLVCACAGDDTPSAPSPILSLLAVGESEFTGVAAEPVGTARVRVVDEDGDPVPDRTVRWTVIAGSTSAASTPTDAAGEAAVTWMLGPTAGTQHLVAELEASTESVAFTATAAAGPPATIELSRSSVELRGFGDAAGVQAYVEDAHGNESDAEVAWSAADTFVAAIRDGRIIAAGGGTTTATATAGPVSVDLSVNVPMPELVPLPCLPGAPLAFPTALNSVGVVVGTCMEDTGVDAPYYPVGWTNGVPTQLPGDSAVPLAVNDAGEIVGRLGSPDSGFAVWWDGTGALDTLLSAPSEARAINSAGIIAGFLADVGAIAGVSGALEPLAPGWSDAYAVNESGTVAGYRQASMTRIQATRWPGGFMHPATTASSVARAIDDLGRTAGEIAGGLHTRLAVWAEDGSLADSLAVPYWITTAMSEWGVVAGNVSGPSAALYYDGVLRRVENVLGARPGSPLPGAQVERIGGMNDAHEAVLRFDDGSAYIVRFWPDE